MCNLLSASKDGVFDHPGTASVDLDERCEVWERTVRYESLSDTLIFHLRPGVPSAEIREDLGGSSYFYDANGELVAMEIVDASSQRELVRSLECRLERFADGLRRRRGSGKEFSDEGGMP